MIIVIYQIMLGSVFPLYSLWFRFRKTTNSFRNVPGGEESQSTGEKLENYTER